MSTIPTDKVKEAALWLATGGKNPNRASFPQLRERGLNALEAVEAIRQAALIRARAT